MVSSPVRHAASNRSGPISPCSNGATKIPSARPQSRLRQVALAQVQWQPTQIVPAECPLARSARGDVGSLAQCPSPGDPKFFLRGSSVPFRGVCLALGILESDHRALSGLLEAIGKS